MRYISVDTISFTTQEGNTYAVKDRREYPSYQKMDSVSVTSDDFIDEIASRYNVYGYDGEDQSFKIVDFNISKLFDNDFNLGKLENLDIPL